MNESWGDEREEGKGLKTAKGGFKKIKGCGANRTDKGGEEKGRGRQVLTYGD